MNSESTNILVIYHSLNGCVKLVADTIAEGAAKVGNVNVITKSVAEVKDEDLLQADGIAFESLKYYGSFSPPSFPNCSEGSARSEASANTKSDVHSPVRQAPLADRTWL